MKEEIESIIEKLLLAIEEEDIGISLFTTHFQAEKELEFFLPPDRGQVKKILSKRSEDSKRHKKILEKIIAHLGRLSRGN